MNDKFIAELHTSEEREKKQRMMENRTRDSSLLEVMLWSVRQDMGKLEEDELGDET